MILKLFWYMVSTSYMFYLHICNMYYYNVHAKFIHAPTCQEATARTYYFTRQCGPSLPNSTNLCKTRTTLGGKLHTSLFKGQLGVPLNSVPIVFIVFSRDSWRL